MRIDDVSNANKELPRKFKLSMEEGRQMAMLSVMTDISETLAIIADLYGFAHGRVISRNEDQNARQQ